jgi:transcriptional regulator with XRE-family HTH domain
MHQGFQTSSDHLYSVMDSSSGSAYNAVHMPAASRLSSALDRQLLIQLGERLRRARQEQGLTTVALAERVGVSRMTLSAVEAGEPAPTMGTYLRVMSALGVAGDLALVATGELRGDPADAAESKIELGASNAPHDVQDLQSLLLHEEAVRLLRQQPELISSALEILEKWRASGSANSRPLLDEWSVILHRRDWRRILARTRRSKELRQASPLAVLLPSEVRQRVLEEVRLLKSGATLGHMSSASRPRRAPPKGGK